MTDHEHLPTEGTIILGPTDDPNIWQLTFKNAHTGEHVRIVLPLDQPREMDAEFTGHIP